MLSTLRQRSHQLMASLAAVVPSFCVLCSIKGDTNICADCSAKFFNHRTPRCYQCADALPGLARNGMHSLCGNCLRNSPAFDATVVATNYAAPVDQLILSLKFGANLVLAPLFSRLLANALLDTDSKCIPMPTILTAVPLGPQRLIERGFNQALEIAKPLSRALAIPLDPHLAVRVRETDSQSTMHPSERRKNVRGAFTVPETAIDLIKRRHIGIVDDVITTGNTLDELAATFKRFGAARVTNLVFARTLP